VIFTPNLREATECVPPGFFAFELAGKEIVLRDLFADFSLRDRGAAGAAHNVPSTPGAMFHEDSSLLGLREDWTARNRPRRSGF